MVRGRHIGSYGLCLSCRRALLIRKARGPYAGLLDLPGGGIEHGESPLEALRREFSEETGLTPAAFTWLCDYSGVARYVNSEGRDEELHHLGFLWRVTLASDGALKAEADGQDSLGASWYDVRDLREADLSPIVRAALAAHIARVCSDEESDPSPRVRK